MRRECKICKSEFIVGKFREYCSQKCKNVTNNLRIKRWYSNNREKVLARQKELKMKYPERFRATQIRYNRKRGMLPREEAFEKFKGENHRYWRGDNKVSNIPGYNSAHNWIKKNLGKPNRCEECNSDKEKVYDWANVSKEYKKDLNDWKRLCRKCHREFDGLGAIV